MSTDQSIRYLNWSKVVQSVGATLFYLGASFVTVYYTKNLMTQMRNQKEDREIERHYRERAERRSITSCPCPPCPCPCDVQTRESQHCQTSPPALCPVTGLGEPRKVVTGVCPETGLSISRFSDEKTSDE